jgi:hypothetical protein
VYLCLSRDSEVLLEQRFRHILQDALAQEGISAADLSRDVGMDKAYFGDLLAGRKRTVSALALMLVAKRFGLDPWELAGVTKPFLQSVAGSSAPAPVCAPPLDGQSVVVPRLYGCGIVEEGAFRNGKLSDVQRSFATADGYPPARQSVLEVRGHDYALWGLPSGSVVHSVSFHRYETVVGPGRMVVASRSESSLTETVLRRIALNPEGDVYLELPDGASEALASGVRRIEGLVVQYALPPLVT